jgi:arsenate reductase
MKNILVLCTGNSCRSQMAHGYFTKKLAGKAKVYSAGVETHGLNPYAVSVMKMDGIDISNNTSNLIDDYTHIKFDFIITVCDHANEACPYMPGVSTSRIHKNFEDPTKLEITDEIKKIDKYIYCRNLIKDFCIEFITNNF